MKSLENNKVKKIELEIKAVKKSLKEIWSNKDNNPNWRVDYGELKNRQKELAEKLNEVELEVIDECYICDFKKETGILEIGNVNLANVKVESEKIWLTEKEAEAKGFYVKNKFLSFQQKNDKYLVSVSKEIKYFSNRIICQICQGKGKKWVVDKLEWRNLEVEGMEKFGGWGNGSAWFSKWVKKRRSVFWKS